MRQAGVPSHRREANSRVREALLSSTPRDDLALKALTVAGGWKAWSPATSSGAKLYCSK
jgi:hypothetical protein